MARARRTRVQRHGPDAGASLSDGVVVDLFVAVRLLGFRVLTLDGRLVLDPATRPPTKPVRSPGGRAPGDGRSPSPRRPPEVEPGSRLAELADAVEVNARRLRELADGRADA